MKRCYMVGIFVIILCCLIGCSHSSKKEVICNQEEVDLSNLVFFEKGHNIVGIDPKDYKLQVKMVFDTYVTYGDISDDQRIFVADDGPRLGIWGEQLFVINDKCQIVHKVKVFPNSRTVKILGNKLIVANSSYTEEAYSGLQIFDADTYQLLYETKKIGNIISKRNIHHYKKYAFIAVPSFEAQKRKSYIIKIDLETLKMQEFHHYTEEHPYDRYDILIDGNKLVIIFHDSRELKVFDLFTDKMIKSIKIGDLINIPNTAIPLDYWFSEPIVIGDNILLLITDNLPNIIYQKVLIFARHTMEFKKEINLDKSYNLRFFSLKYFDDKCIWLVDGEFIGVYNYLTGELIRWFRIDLESL